MTADPGVEVDDLRSASHVAADAAADASIVSEVSIASASATETRTHQPRAANGRFVGRAPGSAPVDEEPDALQADRFLDREISWLQFNERVLQLAADDNVPLLERARYLAIFASQPRRVLHGAGGRPQAAHRHRHRGALGLRARAARGARADLAGRPRAAGSMQAAGLRRAGPPGARGRGHHDRALGRAVRRRARPARRHVHRPAVPGAHSARRRPGPPVPLHLRPVAQPGRGAGQPAHRQGALRPGQGAAGAPPPAARGAGPRRVAAGRHVRHALRPARGRHLGAPRPPLPRHGGARALHLPGHPQRGPRGRGGRRREPPHRRSSASCTRRRFGPPVRLEVEQDMDEHVLDLLVRELGVAASEVYRLPAPLDLRALNVIADLERSDLHFEPFVARTNPDLAPTESAKARDIFASIRKQDVLLQHPYDSFSTSVQAFIEQAATDPRVLAIKQTLYRTSGDSPIIDALIDAAEAGKQVLAVVEIKARFDEQNNISLGPQARARRRATSSTASSGSRPTPSSASSSGRRPRGCAATATSAPATTTPRRPGSTRTSASSPSTTRSARTSPACSTSSPASRHAAGSSACWSPRARCAPACSTSSTPRSSTTSASRASGQHRLEGQLDRRRAAHRRPLPGLAGRRDGAAVGARHLRAAPGRSGAVREHRGALHPRPLPRALADLPVRRRWRHRGPTSAAPT